MKRIFTFLILIFCLNLVGLGQTWVSESGPYGGSGQKNVFYPTSSNFFMLSGGKSGNNNGSIYRSTDNGATWAVQSASIFVNTNNNQYEGSQFVDINILSDGTILAITSSSLYKSTDDGGTWTKVNGAGSSATGFDKAV